MEADNVMLFRNILLCPALRNSVGLWRQYSKYIMVWYSSLLCLASCHSPRFFKHMKELPLKMFIFSLLSLKLQWTKLSNKICILSAACHLEKFATQTGESWMSIHCHSDRIKTNLFWSSARKRRAVLLGLRRDPGATDNAAFCRVGVGTAPRLHLYLSYQDPRCHLLPPWKLSRHRGLAEVEATAQWTLDWLHYSQLHGWILFFWGPSDNPPNVEFEQRRKW